MPKNYLLRSQQYFERKIHPLTFSLQIPIYKLGISQIYVKVTVASRQIIFLLSGRAVYASAKTVYVPYDDVLEASVKSMERLSREESLLATQHLW